MSLLQEQEGISKYQNSTRVFMTVNSAGVGAALAAARSGARTVCIHGLYSRKLLGVVDDCFVLRATGTGWQCVQ